MVLKYKKCFVFSFTLQGRIRDVPFFRIKGKLFLLKGSIPFNTKHYPYYSHARDLTAMIC